MTFDRGGVKAVELPRGGGTERAWVAENPFGPGKTWQRSFRFDITDPVLIDGGRRSIDIEVTYMLNAWGGVHVVVATDEGPQKVENLWGACKGRWKTRRVRINNARLDNTIEGKYDIKLAGDNGPLMLKRIRVIGYDPKENVQWDRMLEVKGRAPTNSAYEPLFAFHPNQQAGLRYTLTNHAEIPAPMERRLTIRDILGEVVHQDRAVVTQPSGAETPLSIPFPIENWPLGAYTARVDLAPTGGDGQETTLSITTLLGVVSTKKLGKARPGEFRFGLDPGTDPTSPEGLAFYDLMGVDMLRNASGDSRKLDIESLRAAYEKLAAHGVTAMLIADPPGQMEKIDEARRKTLLAEKTAHLEKLARELAPLLTYYELGNEPDLPFFYPNSVESYIDSFHAMSEAIHRGNPDAITMNGGLCFHGEEGERRAHRIVELADITKFDMWGYHGHGGGSEAEHNAYNRQVEATRAHNKHTLPFLDTETGVSANSPIMYREQARTGVQKMVFAHAKGMPSLMWFRLFMGDDGYTLSHNRIEPRPSVLAYRAMVERLRHVRVARMIEFDEPSIEAYLFDEIDENSKPTGRKTLVAWANADRRFGVSLRMDENPETIDAPVVLVQPPAGR